jgi:hypothetical protein
MNYKKGILIITLMVFGIISIVVAKPSHKIKFHNQSDETVSYHVFQVDHGIKRHPKPMELVTGTLAPGTYWEVSREQGVYFIVWLSEETNKIILKTERFTLNQDMTFIVGPLPKGDNNDKRGTSN